MRKKIALGGLMMVATMVLAEPAMAQELSSSGVMNDVLKRFHDAAATWGPAIESAASRLFWTLVVISMVWTFGMMALRKADIGEFFAEFVRFTIFTGFFWWLLTNANQGMNIAGTIVQSLQTLGAQAGGLSNSNLGPSSILDLGFELYNRTVQATSELGWRQMATALVMELMALAVLFVLALIAVNLLLVARISLDSVVCRCVLPWLWWKSLDFRHGDQLLQDRAGPGRTAYGNGASGCDWQRVHQSLLHANQREHGIPGTGP